MNRILFDLRGTQPTKLSVRHGGGKYGEIILKRIVERNLPICCCFDSRLWINPDIKNILEQNNIILHDIHESSLQQIVKADHIGLLYVPANTNMEHYRFEECPVIGTIHDLRPLGTPVDRDQMNYKPWKNMLRYLLKYSFPQLYLKRNYSKYLDVFINDNFHFVTVSQHTAKSFTCYFSQYKDLNIPVFYSPSTSLLNTMSTKYEENYFLLVSANRFFKNNLRAIRALDKLFSMGIAKDFHVKVTGVNNPEKAFWYKIKNKDRFDFVGFVDEQELDQLYHDAYCFIYPSLNEGFGYPPLEAMHYGVPVLSSPLSSIPEVCGGNVIYFNPFSVEEIMNRILQIMDKDTHDKYSQLAKERYEIITKKQNEDLDKLIDYIYSFNE